MPRAPRRRSLSVGSTFEVCGSVHAGAGRSGLVALNDGFRHEAFLYADHSELLAGMATFIGDAVASGEPILVVVDGAKIAALRTVLDGDAERVQFADMATVGRNPARIIPVWQAFVDQRSAKRSTPTRHKRADLGRSQPGRVGRVPTSRVAAQRGLR